MKSTTYRRGRVVIPVSIRAKYNIEAGTQLSWIDDGQTIRVIPVSLDPITALYGRGKGQGLLQKLILERKRDRRR
jgi:AbrB family looped-hinge helix DNA binding protein